MTTPAMTTTLIPATATTTTPAMTTTPTPAMTTTLTPAMTTTLTPAMTTTLMADTMTIQGTTITAMPTTTRAELREASRRSLIIAFVLIAGFMVAEIIGGIISGSLALLADAGHMATDAASIALALFAVWIAGRPESIERTFGYQRTEVLAAAFNALSLWVIAGWIVWEAIERFVNHHDIHIEGGLMLTVGGIGLLVNIVAAIVLHAGSKHSLNVGRRVQARIGRPDGFRCRRHFRRRYPAHGLGAD